MNIGDRFEKDGKLVEVVALVPGGYSFKVLPKSEKLPKEPVPEVKAPVTEEKKTEVKPPIARRKRK